MTLKISNNVPKNQQIISFYKTHTNLEFDYVKLNKNNTVICSYNVHGWININADIKYLVNFNNIVDMLSKVNADILVLQEVCLRDELTETYIFNEFKRIGYVDYIIVPNGGCFIKSHESEYLMVLGKKKFEYKENIDVTNGGFIRHCAVIKYDKIKLLAVHLEIGKRFHHLTETSQLRHKIENQNTTIRINQLDIIFQLHNDIDIIVGDFNFMPTNFEVKWLRDNNYTYYGNETNTTPYNRTDMVFLNNDSIIDVLTPVPDFIWKVFYFPKYDFFSYFFDNFCLTGEKCTLLRAYPHLTRLRR